MCGTMPAMPQRKRLIYLDIDGVLNDGKVPASGYSGMLPEPVARLNDLLAIDRTAIVLTSGWRLHGWHLGGEDHAYLLEVLMASHGVKASGRLFRIDQYKRLQAPAMGMVPHCTPAHSAQEHLYKGPETSPEWWEWRAANIAKVRASEITRHLHEYREHIDSFTVIDDVALSGEWWASYFVHTPNMLDDEAKLYAGMTLFDMVPNRVPKPKEQPSEDLSQ